jgi:ubiquinone biosynthesis UbiH/UbiF/VisC/COQ6 family hydroxylase
LSTATTTTSRSEVAIVGAGLIGSAIALWLAKHTTYSISLIERNPVMSLPHQANQRVVALGALATDFLDDVGVFSSLTSEHCNPYQKMFVWDENSDGELAFDAANINQVGLGHMVDSQMCTYQLQQAVLNSRVNCHFDVRASKLELNRSGASLDTDLGRFDAKLLIAADGSQSWVRQQAKIFANRQGYGQRGIVAKISSSKPHQNCAWQCFLSTGPVAILPLSENQNSVVWSADNALAKQLMGMDDDAFGDALGSALQGRLGKTALLSKRQSFELASLRAEQYYKRSLVLLGDAAHSIHPLAGQGANLGFKDALVLGGLLVNSKASEIGSPRLLSIYQARRQADNNQTDALMSALHQAYKFDLPVWMLARGLGMNSINKSSILRNALARQAMGL